MTNTPEELKPCPFYDAFCELDKWQHAISVQAYDTIKHRLKQGNALHETRPAEPLPNENIQAAIKALESWTSDDDRIEALEEHGDVILSALKTLAPPLPEDKAEALDEQPDFHAHKSYHGTWAQHHYKTIVAALSAPAVDVEGLKKIVSDAGYGTFAVGAIDYLIAQGHQQPKEQG
jgi:hypothetical protein